MSPPPPITLKVDCEWSLMIYGPTFISKSYVMSTDTNCVTKYRKWVYEDNKDFEIPQKTPC